MFIKQILQYKIEDGGDIWVRQRSSKKQNKLSEQSLYRKYEMDIISKATPYTWDYLNWACQFASSEFIGR